MKQENKTNIGNAGIISGLFVPLIGIILAIIAIAKDNQDTNRGILALIISILSWFFGILILALL